MNKLNLTKFYRQNKRGITDNHKQSSMQVYVIIDENNDSNNIFNRCYFFSKRPYLSCLLFIFTFASVRLMMLTRARKSTCFFGILNGQPMSFCLRDCGHLLML